ncbi:MAG: hypothetical protein FRX49_07823 [Trebouxia sp. A1-2]|nr:MAG: hypothetical protein FRX49_07823 [Trebouxia sp. A1-2]
MLAMHASHRNVEDRPAGDPAQARDFTGLDGECPAGCVAFLSKAAPAVVLTTGLHRDAHRVGHQRLGTTLDVNQAGIGITWAACTAGTARRHRRCRSSLPDAIGA